MRWVATSVSTLDDLTAMAPLTRVAALIVHYRTYGDLHDCLAAFARHEPDMQIVVVDYEADLAEVETLGRRWPSVQVLPLTDNRGFAAGANLAARHAAEATHLLVLNPDTLIEEPWLQAACARLGADPSLGALGPRVLEQDGSLQASARRFPGIDTVIGGRSTWLTRIWPSNPWSRGNLLTGSEVTTPRLVDWVSGACLLVTRQAFDRVGGFDEGFFMYWEDADFCRRLREAGLRTVYDPTATVRHLTGRASKSAPALAQARFHQSVFRYYLKHGGTIAWLGAPLVWPALQLRRMMVTARAPRE